MGNNVNSVPPGCTMLPAPLPGSGDGSAFKARKVLTACTLAVAQETIFDVAEGPSLSHFSNNCILAGTLKEQDLKTLCECLCNDRTCVAQSDVRDSTAN